MAAIAAAKPLGRLDQRSPHGEFGRRRNVTGARFAQLRGRRTSAIQKLVGRDQRIDQAASQRVVRLPGSARANQLREMFRRRCVSSDFQGPGLETSTPT